MNSLDIAVRLVQLFHPNMNQLAGFKSTPKGVYVTWKGVDLFVSYSEGIPAEDIGPRFFVEESDRGILRAGTDITLELERMLNGE
jgi:hypothetical protein